MQDHLNFLYGMTRAAELLPRLHLMLDRWRMELARRPGARRGHALSQGDALLITYGDQVTTPGQRPLETLAAFATTHLVDVVSGIHILPFYPWSSDDGFAVKDFSAVDPALGDWPDVERLGRQFDLMFDAVFNHLSAQGEWFQRWRAGDPKSRDFFVTVEGEPDLSQVVRPRTLPLLTAFPTIAGLRRVWTTFSADQVDLNVQNPEVLLALLDVLLFYVSKGARFIRLDAIGFLWKEIGTPCLHLPQTHRIIQLMRTVLNEVAPDVRLITETNVPHADNISYFGDGTNEAQLVYNFALPPLVLHAMQTGDATKLTRWAKSLTLPSQSATFFNFLASHDGIGVNPARGILSDAEIAAMIARVEAHGGFLSHKNMPDGSQVPYEMNINYLDALSQPAAGEANELAARKLVTAQAVMLALQGVPGIYFHSLLGSRGDRAGAESSGIKRRINREKCQRTRLEADLQDPTTLRALVFTRYRELLTRRRQHAAFAPVSPQRVLELDPRVFAVERVSPDAEDRVLCLHNLSAQEVEVRAANGRGGKLAPFAHQWVSG